MPLSNHTSPVGEKPLSWSRGNSMHLQHRLTMQTRLSRIENCWQDRSELSGFGITDTSLPIAISSAPANGLHRLERHVLIHLAVVADGIAQPIIHLRRGRLGDGVRQHVER